MISHKTAINSNHSEAERRPEQIINWLAVGNLNSLFLLHLSKYLHTIRCSRDYYEMLIDYFHLYFERLVVDSRPSMINLAKN